MNRILVFYHKHMNNPCPDGFGAAWAAWKVFGNKAEYIGIQNGTEPLFEIKNSEVYFLDTGFREEVMKRLVGQNKKVVFIDHHITRKDYVKFIPEGSFDIDSSAAVLSWKYFHPGKKVPKLLKYAEDYDLWRFKMPKSREVASFIDLYPKDFKTWSRLAMEFENPEMLKKYVDEGKTILQYQERIVSDLAQNGEEVVFENKKAMAINSPVFISEIGEYIREVRKIPLAIIWYKNNAVISVSLRSSEEVDCSKIALKYGGGGHPRSSGFSLREGQSFPWKRRGRVV